MAADPGTTATWWTLLTAFGGSIVGATVSAVVSFSIQKRNLDAAKRQRDEDKLELRKARGYSLLFKMIKLSSSLENLGKAIQSCFDQAEQHRFEGAPWQIVQPIVGGPDEVHFAPEEMALLLSIDDKLFNEIAALDELHNSTVALSNLYGQMRTKVLERFGAVMSGPIGAIGLTQEEVNWLSPRAAELNSLIEALKQRCDVDGAHAWSMLLKLRDSLEMNLGIKHRLIHRSEDQSQAAN
ncbi:hypothetical protein SR870_16395 [Rhodopseudomonas palustris]|uniref:hypothetical protein n=1 Tax=Rhodopseudomonas palustris TaxID=1076 RepID=UPI002ACD442A|nr:hypothetical protein [Rhodopseudomonas palustris]WQG98277.1 hypothetical protein SR870_16395 [Rhodopseudomonas palustris]